MGERDIAREVAQLGNQQTEVYVFDLEQGLHAIELWEGGGDVAARISASYASSAIDTAEALRQIGLFMQKTWSSRQITFVVRTYTAHVVLVVRAGAGFRHVARYISTVRCCRTDGNSICAGDGSSRGCPGKGEEGYQVGGSPDSRAPRWSRCARPSDAG